MTPNEKLKCIAEQAVYEDLKVFNMSLQQYEDIALIGLPRENDWKINCLRIACYKPALRPLSDLTKEITHKGYNDDKPFTPIIELEPHFDELMYNDDLDNGIEPYSALEYSTYTGHRFVTTDLLHLWHFDTRNLIEKGEAIDVNTLDINPYEV